MTATESPVDIQTTQLKKASLYFRAINHKLRQEMLRKLHNEGGMCVTSLYVKLRLEQSIVSQHLAILRRADLVIAERAGKLKFYKVNYDQLAQLHQIANQLVHQ